MGYPWLMTHGSRRRVLLSLFRGACEGPGHRRGLALSRLLCRRAPQCTDTGKHVQAYLPTRGNFSRSARFFLLRRIFRNHEGTDVPGTSVMEKFPSFHPCMSGQMGRVSPPPQAWYCSTYFVMFFPLLEISVLSCIAITEHKPEKIGSQQCNNAQSDRHPREPIPTREGRRGRPRRTPKISSRQAATRGTILWKVEFDTS